MIAAILDTHTLGKVILYSLGAGTGVTVVFALGVSSTAGMIDAVREGRTVAVAMWAATAALCVLASLGAIVLGVVAMTAK
ncbi:MAG: hypothetical protein QOJ25_2099 [Solirubrobacteraceae bacterium]|jgi:hypothetical protein|nr:hypothetical protein [Solirubrobacteraceae bacterium]